MTSSVLTRNARKPAASRAAIRPGPSAGGETGGAVIIQKGTLRAIEGRGHVRAAQAHRAILPGNAPLALGATGSPGQRCFVASQTSCETRWRGCCPPASRTPEAVTTRRYKLNPVVLSTYFRGAISWARVSRRRRFPVLDPRRAQFAAFARSSSRSPSDSHCSAILSKQPWARSHLIDS
jgi:hypothetical protein